MPPCDRFGKQHKVKKTPFIMSSNEDSDNSCDSVVKCSYCYKNKEILPSKTYCQECADRCFRECSRCRRPFHDKKYFMYSDKRCNACHRKYITEKTKREQRKKHKLQISKDCEQEKDRVPEKQRCDAPVGKIIGYLPIYHFQEGETQK